MCDATGSDYLSQKYSCEGVTEDSGNGEYSVNGHTDAPDGSMIVFWAPNPPNYNGSYSGSGLPFPSPTIAFDNTPNKGVRVQGGQFRFQIHFPNSFYAGLGTYYVSPQVYYKICGNSGQDSKVHAITLGDGIPFRTLTYPPPPNTAPRRNCMVYGGRDSLPVRTQEQILRDSGYPDKNLIPDNFWGSSIPN
jgi:hypothetical protein